MIQDREAKAKGENYSIVDKKIVESYRKAELT
jgi:hypothetical protein